MKSLTKLFFNNYLRALLAIFVITASQASTASVCIFGQVKEVGNWINTNVQPNDVTQVIITEECKTKVVRVDNGDGTTTQTTHTYIQHYVEMWKSCWSGNCNWGKVAAAIDSDGSGLVFSFDHGYGVHRGVATIWSGGDNWLGFLMTYNFTGQPSSSTFVWLSRQ